MFKYVLHNMHKTRAVTEEGATCHLPPPCKIKILDEINVNLSWIEQFTFNPPGAPLQFNKMCAFIFLQKLEVSLDKNCHFLKIWIEGNHLD